jgi:hypothetical protein
MSQKEVRLKNPAHRRGIHTSYVGAGGGQSDAGTDRRMTSQTFLHGRARGVDAEKATLLRKSGQI